MSKQPLVSAVVVCYNHARFVLECLESVRKQTYGDLELIVVDDCSKDDSATVIQGWLKQCQFPWQFVEHRENQGICRSLNDALRQAKGKYISMVAADDLWLPDKIERQVRVMECEVDTVGILYSDVQMINEEGDLLPGKTFIASHSPPAAPPSGNILEPLWRFGNWIPAMSTLIRRRCYDSVGSYDESLYYEDYDMWLRMAERFHFKFHDRVSAKYRVIPTSMVRCSWPKICDAAVRMCLKHMRRSELPREVRPLVEHQLGLWAKRCFASHSPRYKSAMLAAARQAPSLQVIVPALFALGGLSFAQYQRVLKCFRRQSGRAASTPSGQPESQVP